MLRRVLGALSVGGAILFSWGAVAQPTAPVFRSGIAPAPAGSAGRYELRHSRTRALFTDRSVELSLPSHTQEARALGWSVAGGRSVTPRAEKPREAKLHRLVGPTESWEREVPTYGGLRYPGVLPGVDLWFEERPEGMEYGFRAERGADLRRVRLEYAGARAVRVVEEGRALEVDLGEGVLREEGLRCWQEAGEGASRTVGCRFTDAHRVGHERWAYAIEVDVEDPERPVVVDPLVLWNTYLGSRFDDELRAISQNDAGEVFVVGTVSGPPVTPPTDGGADAGLGGWHGNQDVFVARFQNDGGLVWSTLLGGSGEDFGRALFVGGSDEVYVAGTTASADLQGVLADGGVGSSRRGAGDGFVARLAPSGQKLDWFLHVGGTNVDRIQKMIPGPPGKLFVIGESNSSDLNVVGAPMLPPTTFEAFAARVDTTALKTDWFAVVQGVGDDTARDVAYDSVATGVLYFTGGTQAQVGGSRDAYLKTIEAVTEGSSASPLSTRLLGGTGDDEGQALSLLPSQVVVWGNTASALFPNAGSRRGSSDIFVSVHEDWLTSAGKLTQTKAFLVGGAGGDVVNTVTTDPSGRLYLGGYTFSADLPVAGGFDTQLELSGVDGLVARVRLDEEPPVDWASYVGGSGVEEVLALRFDNQHGDRLLIGGSTTSQNLGYSDAGYNPRSVAGGKDMLLLSVDLRASTDAGTDTPDSGTPDSGTPDSGTGDGGTGSEAVSPLGWSCGASGSQGGWGALALGSLAGLVLLASRRRPRT